MSAHDNAYAGRHSDVWLAHMADRQMEDCLDFLMPHLCSGMRVLDCGCGPGALTIGLARHLQPGEVVGLDVDARYISMAQEQAAQEALNNVTFKVGSAYDLPFPNQTFDAVSAHTLLEHLTAL